MRALAFAAIVGCAHAPDITLAESVPLETELRDPTIPLAGDVWLDMVRGAKRSIDLGEFYVSDQAGTRLHAILEEIEHAAARGVHVRLIVDEQFYKKYPEVPDAWSKRPNMEVHHMDLHVGVMHAKYFIIDEREAYLGSQNFDWRSLDHVFEVGARIRTPHVVAALERVFRADWTGTPLEDADHEAILAASPKSLTPPSLWDLPRLLAWIAEAKRAIDVEVLTYKTTDRDGSQFHDLDDALRAAAKRGVHVRLLVSTWGENEPAVDALSKVIQVKVLAIPPFSGGDIPFARIAHAKYAVFDGQRSWLGTSNWEGDYFTHSRNVGLFLSEGDVPTQLERVFDALWISKYARSL
jgi:phosphatidylserine/phosphatidylglycerophosphate/cardiolipin synthase-like enzyme